MLQFRTGASGAKFTTQLSTNSRDALLGSQILLDRMGASLFSLRKFSFRSVIATGAVLVVLALASWSGSALVDAAKESADQRAELNLGPDNGQIADPVESIAIERSFIHTLPADLGSIQSVSEVKARFVEVLLPHVLEANELVMGERSKLLEISYLIEAGKRLSPADAAWLQSLAKRYRVKDADIAELLRRVDVIPPSLALTQAAIESGWGRSRFAVEGQALFGQWTSVAGAGIVPADRSADATHEVRKFASLGHSVRSYMRNLNSHRAYRQFRSARAEIRAAGDAPDGHSLSVHLYSYSSRGVDYVADVQSIMQFNDLRRYDHAKFAVLQTAENELSSQH